MYIYEGGALTYYYTNNIFYKSTEWRNKLDNWASDNNTNTFNPAKNFEIEKNHTYTEKLIVDQNNYYINKCDICVVCIDDIDKSPGTIYELTRFKELNKPVIAFGTQGKHWSPHINSCISEYCDTVEDVIELLTNMFAI
jgi:nucleoside 2-deoxyribosyltransferase